MAKVMEIGDVVRKCKVLLLDIEGTTTSISFIKDKLFIYADEHVKGFLEKQWDTDDVKDVVAALRKQAAEDQEKSVAGFVAIAGEDATKEEQIESLVNNVKAQMLAERKNGPLKQLQGVIWKEGYDNGTIKGHVYDDVFPALELWRSTEGKKVYIYSSGSVQAQKLLFNKSQAGDMLPLIDGHFDTAVGAKQDPASYAAIVEKIGCKAEEILFLTDIVKEAEAACTSGLQAALVSREGNERLPANIKDSFIVLHSFDQLAVTNKRKPDPQVEELPAKVPKTDIQDDVKSASDMDTEAACSSEMSEAIKIAVAELTEAMEVDAIDSDTKADSAVEAATTEVSDDVPMTDSSLAANDSENKAKETDSTTEVVKTANEDNSDAEAIVEAPKVSDSKVEQMKSVKIIEAKTKMVDVATVTDSSNKVDVATETILESSAGDAPQLKSVEAPELKSVEEPELKSVEAPELKSVEALEPKSVEVSELKSAETPELKSVEATELKSVEATELKSVEVTELKSVAAPIEQTVEAEILTNEAVDSKSDEEAGVVKIDIVTDNGIEPDNAKSVENSEKKTISNGSTAENITAVKADVTKYEEILTFNNVADQKESAEVPEINIEPVIKEVGEKTEIKETEVIETQVSTTAMDHETVSEQSTPMENPITEASIEETASVIEIKDITDEKESLEEIADSIEDVVPIVEEPSSHLEAEALQNAGDVLEKECDEILSKVQDVTNLDLIPVKALHTITEEMETENADSNDIVERILDTEMELSIKNQEDDQNMVQEMDRPKMEAENTTDVVEEKKSIDVPEETVEMCVDTNEQPPEKNNGDVSEVTLEPTVVKMEAELAILKGNVVSDNAAEMSRAQESNSDSQTIEKSTKSNEPEQKPKSDINLVTTSQETTENGKENTKNEDVIDTKVNGKANDAPTVKLNGNSTPDDNLKSRLAVENGKEKVNGSNGDSADAENDQGDNKTEAEIAEIKTTAKTVATEDMRAPKEQPVDG